ncbi:MAG: flagellar hook-associated protein FlgL [Gammaproteobacteria bacterium]
MRVTTNQIFFRSLNSVLSLQDDIHRSQLQVGTGRRVLKASDDPVASSQALNLSGRLNALDQYERNSGLATLRLAEQESAIDGAQNTLQRVRELVLQAKNRSMTTADRRFIAAEINERLNEMLNLANKRNASNEFIFAGTAVDTLPFTTDAAGAVQYNGNFNTRELEISEGRTVGEGLSGADVFMAVRNGNGTFVSSLGTANTGTGRVINDTVVDVTSFTTDSFRIVFTAPDTYDVVNDTAGTTVASAQPYTPGTAIPFNGISVAITGAPATGDAFLIGPSRHQSVFATIAKARDDMSVDLTTPELGAEFSFNMDRALSDIDLALDSLNSIRAQIGARQHALDAQSTINAEAGIQLETVKSRLLDIDMVEAISDLARQTQALEAAQQAFVKVQGLSLFNFIR